MRTFWEVTYRSPLKTERVGRRCFTLGEALNACKRAKRIGYKDIKMEKKQAEFLF